MLTTWTELPTDVDDVNDFEPAEASVQNVPPLETLITNDQYEVYRGRSLANPDFDDYHILHFSNGKVVSVEHRTHLRSVVFEKFMRDRYGRDDQKSQRG